MRGACGGGAAFRVGGFGGDGGGLGADQIDAARLMRQSLVEFMALGRDILVEQAGGVKQGLHEGKGPPQVEADQG